MFRLISIKFFTLALALLPVLFNAGVSSAADTGKLTVVFEYQGKPTKGSLIVSDGTTRQQWTNVEEISAEVPSAATYIIDLKPPGDTQPIPITFRDILPMFKVPAGGTRNIVISVLPAELPKPFEPVLFIREAGAEVTVQNRVEQDSANPGLRRLTSIISRPEDSFTVLDSIYATDADDPADIRDFTCGDNCPHLYHGIDCSGMCYTCSSTCVSRGYWQANYNMCEGIITSEPPGPVESEWEELPLGVGGLHLSVALWNDGAIYPQRASIRGRGYESRLDPPFKTRSFPDFTAPKGDYLYSVTFAEGSVPQAKEPQVIELPVSIPDGRIGNLVIRMPQSAADLRRPVAIADNRLGAVLREERITETKDGVAIALSSSDPDPGTIWYAIAVPDGSQADQVAVTREGEVAEPGLGFVVGRILGQRVVIVRSDGQKDLVQVSWSG